MEDGRNKEQIVDAMRTALSQWPGVVWQLQPADQSDRVEESISGIRGQIVVKIYGEDLHPCTKSWRRCLQGPDHHAGPRCRDLLAPETAQHIVAEVDR